MKKKRFRYEVLILTHRGFYDEMFVMNSLREVKDFLVNKSAYIAGRPVRVIDTKTGEEKKVAVKIVCK